MRCNRNVINGALNIAIRLVMLGFNSQLDARALRR